MSTHESSFALTIASCTFFPIVLRNKTNKADWLTYIITFALIALSIPPIQESLGTKDFPYRIGQKILI